MGKYGTCVALPQTGQLLVTETAGKMQAISILIASIPEPKAAEEAGEAQRETGAPAARAGRLSGDGDQTGRRRSRRFPSSFPTRSSRSMTKPIRSWPTPVPTSRRPSRRRSIRWKPIAPPINSRDWKSIPVDLPDPEQLVEQLESRWCLTPRPTLDKTLGRLLVFAEPKDQDAVKEMLQKLGAAFDAGTRQVVVYQPKHFDPTALTTLIKQLAPRAEVSTDAQLRRVVVGARPTRP